MLQICKSHAKQTWLAQNLQLKYNQTGNINQGMQTGADYSFDYLMEEGKPANIKKILAIY